MENIKKTGFWTEPEVEFLKANAVAMSASQIAEKLNRSQESVRGAAFRFDISFRAQRKAEGNIQTRNRISAHDAWLCRELYKEGLKVSVIAEKMEISREATSKIIHNKSHVIR